MSLTLTELARNSLGAPNIQPMIVLEIDGVATVFATSPVKKPLKYGDPDVQYGDPGVKYGQFILVGDQSTYVTFDGTTTKINQTLNQDRGISSDIQSMQIALVDVNSEITNLITPGQVVPDTLGRKCLVWFGFEGTAFKRDFIIIFRGTVEEIDSRAGKIVFGLVHSDSKKKQDIYNPGETETDGATGTGGGSLVVASAVDFLYPVPGPSGGIDAAFKSYIQIEDEIIQYTGTTATSFTGVTRAALSTFVADHPDGTSIKSFYRLDGDALTLALKMMLSSQGPFAEGVAIKNFVRIDASTLVSDSIFFSDIDVEQEFGVMAGDYISTSGASNGANNVSLKTIASVNKTAFGSYIVVNGVSFIEENDTAGALSFRSRYDVLPQGLQMGADEVDVAEHERIRSLFLSGFNYDFYITDIINGIEWLEEQIYAPAAAYSVPRKARSSVGYHIGPIPGDNPKILNAGNIRNPDNIRIRRRLGRNFYNTVVYKYETNKLDTSEFLRGTIAVNTDSTDRIKVGTKALIIRSQGMRDSLLAVTLSNTATIRRLNRYKFAAEHYGGLDVFLGDAFEVEVGDIVVLDTEGLHISNTATGDRSQNVRLFEVVNKTFDIEKGSIDLSLVDTSFDGAGRYCLISPSSKIDSAVSAKQFYIKQSFSGAYGTQEYLKWTKLTNPVVIVRSPDGTILDSGTITDITGNRITLDANLSFTPLSDYIMELSSYNDATTEVKLLYGFMRDTPPFDDAGVQYQML